MSSFWKKTLIWLGLEDEGPEEGISYGEPPGSAGDARTLGGGYDTAGQVSGYGGKEDVRYGEAGHYTEPPRVTVRTEPSSSEYVASTYIPSGVETAGFDPGSGVRMLPPTDTRVQVIEPEGFADAQEIGERFRQSQPVIVDLSEVERDTARRIVDFASGLTFALRGRMRKIGDHAFLLLPAHASIPEDEKDRLRASGYDV